MMNTYLEFKDKNIPAVMGSVMSIKAEWNEPGRCREFLHTSSCQKSRYNSTNSD